MKIHGLAKVEIKAKEIEGATVVVEYKLVLTNEGELPTSVNKVIDYLPDGLEFSSELNKSWVEQRNGELINTSLTNQKIEAGESVELTLVLTKSMTANSTGTFSNTAEIGEISNSLGIKDTDSIPENKAEQEDDYSKADLIISVSTGAIVYISVALGILVFIGIIIYLNIKFGKFKISKKSIFGMILIGVIFVQSSTSFAAATYDFAPPESVLFHYDGSDGNGNFTNINASTFTSLNPNIGKADCIESGHNAFSRDTVCYWYADEVISSNTTSVTEGSLVLTKLNEDTDITINEKNSNYIIGPLKINRADDNTYTYQVMTSQGSTLTGVVCDANGNNKSITGQSSSTFYLKVPVSNISSGDGIASVKITAKVSVTKTTQTKQVVKAKYKPQEDGYDRQAMKTRNTFTRIVDETESSVTKSGSVIWLIPYGNLEIVKQDADNSSVKLKGVQIRVTGTNFDKTYTTDANGKVTIKDLKQGTYTITEISNPYYGYNVMVTGTVTVRGGMTNTYTLKNTKQTGNLKIEKQDADSGEYLEGVSFNIKRKDENKYIQVKVGNEWKTKCEGIIHLSDIRFVDNEENATVFTTNEDGIIEIRNILKGTYEVKEISVGNKYFGYEIDDEYISWSYTSVANDSNKGAGTGKTATVAVWRRSSVNTENPPAYENRNEVLTFKNQKKYVNLSGYVWLDKNPSKQSERNDLYKTNYHPNINGEYNDDSDELMAGIKVTLKDKTTGETVLDKDGKEMTTKTTENGSYLFEKVKINNLSNYYVEFEYNGLKYQNVTKNLDKDTGSKAEEGERRQEFNNKFETVTNTKKIDEIEFQYISENHVSTLNNSDSFSKMQADTKTAGYNIAQYYDPTKDIIENINLGLYEREQPDIALIKDIDNVKLSINGYNHVYEYGQRFNNAGTYEQGFNVGVKFGAGEDEYGNMSYSRAVYKADYEYKNESDSSKELKVYVTYKIRMKNESSNLTVKVNSVVDYFDINYYKNKDGTYNEVKVGTRMDAQGNIGMYINSDDEAVGAINPSVEEYGDYAKTIIDTNVKIEAQEYFDMYVQFELNREAVINILNEGDNLNNVAEIYSYTTYDDNKLYAGVDKDSKPGNAEPGNKETYEDDTDSAPGLQLEVAEAREMTGKVFLDDSSESGGAGNEREGSGAYEDREQGISGVTVTLKEKESGKEYKTTTLSASDINESGLYGFVYNEEEDIYIVEAYNEDNVLNYAYTNVTKDNDQLVVDTELHEGDFLIKEFIPGDYTLTYTWGDETYIVNEDGSTKLIDVDAYKGTIYDSSRDQNNKSWYKENIDTRLTDAIDNYTTRGLIDSGADITTMDSTTPTMGIGVEYETTYTASSGDKYTYRISNVDFGIVERARQEIDVGKKVKSVEITLANGQTLATYKVNDDGTVEKSTGITYIPPSLTQSNGMIKAEIDSELIQGATVKIQYAISLTNNSEVDYDSEEYYLYGTEGTENEIIKYIPSGIYDYLDSTLALAENPGWETKTITDYNESVSEPTITEDYLYRYNSVSTDSEGNVIEYTGYESFNQQYQVEEWNMDTIKVARTKRLADKTILYNGDIESKIENITPGGDPVELATLTASKVLANTDEINLNNDVEITKVTRNSQTGRTITLTSVYDIAESVVVTPPTGEDKNYIPLISIMISSFIILGTGIVFIKKKVLG